MDLYIQEYGTKISKEQNHFIIKTKSESKRVAKEKVHSIIICENCSLTSNFLEMMAKEKIPLYFADKYGNIYGKFWKNSFDSSAILRRKQLILFQKNFGKEIIKEWLIEKIEGQKKHLIKLYIRRKKDFSEIEKTFQKAIINIKNLKLDTTNFYEILLGYEGNSSKYYYKTLTNCIPSTWNYKGRKNYKAQDPYNIVLNYLFGVLYSKIDHALTIAGLDTKIGILHGESRKNNSLVYDFIEKFRFIVWETTFSLFSKKLINKSFFSSDSTIEYHGKKIILTEFYKKMNQSIEKNNKTFTLKTLIIKEARNLSKVILEYEDNYFI